MDDEGTRCRNRLGAVTFVIALIGALLAIFPATAPVGGLLCLGVVVPAILAVRRVWKGTADTRRRSVAALVGAPLFFAVALATTPSPPLTAAVVEPAAVAPAVAAPVGPAAAAVLAAAPSGEHGSSARAAAAAPKVVAGAGAGAGAAAAAAARLAVAPRAVAPGPRAAEPAAAQPAAAQPAAAKPAAARPAPAPAASCPTADHYVNSSGACVLRPVQAATAPAGASAQCKDRTYSFSQHRSGTCSGHGGVSRWL